MIQKLRENFAVREYRKILETHGKQDARKFGFPESIKSIIVIQNLAENQMYNAQILHDLKRIFNCGNIDLVNPNSIKTEQKKFSGFPKDDYFIGFKGKKYDLLIDLSENYDRFIAYIIAHIAAEFKLRLYSQDEGDELFQFSLNIHVRDMTTRLKTLRHYAGQFI